MILKRLLFILALALAPLAAQAQTSPKQAQARVLVDAMGVRATFDSILPQIMQQIGGAMAASNPAIKGDLDAILPMMAGEMIKRSEEIIDQIAGVYADLFSDKEIAEMITFFGTETGRHFAKEQPVIAQRSMLLGSQWGQKVAADMAERIREELRKRGHKL